MKCKSDCRIVVHSLQSHSWVQQESVLTKGRDALGAATETPHHETAAIHCPWAMCSTLSHWRFTQQNTRAQQSLDKTKNKKAKKKRKKIKPKKSVSVPRFYCANWRKEVLTELCLLIQIRKTKFWKWTVWLEDQHMYLKISKNIINTSRDFVAICTSPSRTRSQRNGNSEFPHKTKAAVHDWLDTFSNHVLTQKILSQKATSTYPWKQ